jgi:hypothetical protein
LDRRPGVCHLPGAFLGAGARLGLPGRLRLAARAGGGVVWWAGLVPGNPFTLDGAASTGPVPMPSLRAALDLSYDVTRSIRVNLGAALQASWPPGGLRSSVSRLALWQLQLGLEYSL